MSKNKKNEELDPLQVRPEIPNGAESGRKTQRVSHAQKTTDKHTTYPHETHKQLVPKITNTAMT